MVNEWKEFCAYTGTPDYTCKNKNDSSYLGRFTFDTIMSFEGMRRILTRVAGGYLFHGRDGIAKRCGNRYEG